MRSRAITEEPNAYEIMKGEGWGEGAAGIDSEGAWGGFRDQRWDFRLVEFAM